jgi:hypothetical protein
MRSVLRALLVVLFAGAACKGKTEVSFQIAIPNSVAGETEWFEIGAFRDASCAALKPLLGGGIPDGAAKRVAFNRSEKVAPRIGDLARGSYAFGAVAKSQDCAVLATGCAEVDLDKSDSVEVQLSATDARTGACGQGASCQAARCVPTNDNADPSIGVNCSLELLGAGPLANPIGGAGTLVSAPGIATTPSGFVIVYREVDPNGTTARVTILPVDNAGGALEPSRPPIAGRCPSSDENDGIGLAMNGADGRIVLARPACGARPGLEVIRFATKPEVTVDQVAKSADSNAQKLFLSPSSIAALRPGVGDALAFVEDGMARISTLGANAITGPTGTFGIGQSTGAWATATDKVLAVLAAGPGDPVTPQPDAGADGGSEGGVDGGTPTSTNVGPTLRLVMVPASTALGDLVAPDKPRPPIAFPGEIGAIAARGSRVIVVSDGGGPGRSVTWRTFDLNGTAPVDTDGFSIDGKDKVTAVDTTMQGDRVYIAALKTGQIVLQVYANASTKPTQLRQVSFAREPRIPLAQTVRDGRVAVAATSTRVAVAWTTAKALTNNDATGGYAVFACAP